MYRMTRVVMEDSDDVAMSRGSFGNKAVAFISNR